MAIVVDTSVVIAVAANESLKPRLISITRGEELLAPVTLQWEIGNAISAMFKCKRLSLEQGLALLAECQRVPVQLLTVSVDDSLRLAAHLGIYAYDAFMIQCARETGCRLLSLDSGLRHAAREAGVAVLEVNV